VSVSQFKFRRNDQIGTAGAEEDEFLSTCFVDTGDLSLLQNVSDHRQIVLGRTGMGKTALLERLRDVKGEHVITVSPENLALTYVSNSTILKFFSNLGVNLDPFFKLLWRHIFTVEVLTSCFKNLDDAQDKSLLDRITSLFSGNSRNDKEMKEAVKYLQEWGSTFWQETEFRVKEITKKIESELSATLRAKLGTDEVGIGAGAEKAEKLTEGERAELCSRGQEIVSKAQVQDLHKVTKLLDAVLGDRQKQYYIVIDGLDENWIEEKLRYKLIMALILTAKDFIQVRNAKIIIALRKDLIERVFRLNRDSGFQEEKYQSLYLPLVWKKNNLIELLDRRIDALVRRRFTGQPVTHRDFLPKQYNGVAITDYIFTIAQRPRDVISFFNTCISTAQDLSKLGAKQLKDAEAEYSKFRLRALGDEWSADYPSLLDFSKILQRRPSSFKIAAIKDKEIEEFCLDISVQNLGNRDALQQQALQVAEGFVNPDEFKIFLMKVFYRVGLVGLKLQPHQAATWETESSVAMSALDVSSDSSVLIHPTYHRVLGIKP
jgi:hypothetical protein